MSNWVDHIWPNPAKMSAAEKEERQQADVELDARINDLRNLCEAEPTVYLEAVRRIADEEDRRKSGAETRATTFIAAVATLIPLMTWALGNTDPKMCSPGWGCVAWSATFILSVAYFVTAAYWALQALAVSNYQVIGVEDIVRVREQEKSVLRELIKQTLILAHSNRYTINKKLVCIKVAQKRFFNGLLVLGFLLMLDPLSRFGVFSFLQSKIGSWAVWLCNAFSQ